MLFTFWILAKLVRYTTNERCTVLIFDEGRAHLLLVSETPGKPGGVLGVVTLEGAIFIILHLDIF